MMEWVTKITKLVHSKFSVSTKERAPGSKELFRKGILDASSSLKLQLIA